MDEHEAKARIMIEAAQREATASASLGNRMGQSILHRARAATALHVTLLGGRPVVQPGGGQERRA